MSNLDEQDLNLAAILDDLERLQKLRETGAVNEEEFQAQKAAIFVRDQLERNIESTQQHPPTVTHSETVKSESTYRTIIVITALCFATIVLAAYFMFSSESKAPRSISSDEVAKTSLQSEVAEKLENPEPAKVIQTNFSIKYQDIAVDYGFGTRQKRLYYLLNSGDVSSAIEWVSVNERPDCLAVPILSPAKDGILKLAVVSDSTNNLVGDFLNLKVGQSILIDMPETCGEPIMLTVGTNEGEVKIGT